MLRDVEPQMALHQENVYQVGKLRSIGPFQAVSIQYSAFLHHACTTKLIELVSSFRMKMK